MQCSFCHKDDTLADSTQDRRFCLAETENGLELKHDHACLFLSGLYNFKNKVSDTNDFSFVQVQCQLFCTKTSYCDFVLWTKQEVHIERIYPDEEFWLVNLALVKDFYTTAILPELLGKFFSRPHQSHHIQTNAPAGQEALTTGPTVAGPTGGTDVYCYCNGPDEGQMVGCDNSDCLHIWFHLKCLGLKSEPKFKLWYCPECRQRPEFQRRKKRKCLQTQL